MKVSCFIALIILSYACFSQMKPSEYYALSARISKQDTLGIYHTAFSGKASLYSSLLKGDYYFYVKNDSKNALLEYNNAFQFTGIDQNDSLKALINSKIGGLYYYNDHYTEAIKYFNKASLYYDFKPKNKDQVRVYIFSGIIHNTLGRDKEAEKAYKVGIRYFRERGDHKNKAAIQNNLAVLYMNKGDYQRARVYFDSSLQHRLKINDFNGIGQSYNNLGTLNFFQEDYRNALDFYVKGYDYRKKGGSPQSGLLESEINIGQTYRKLNDKKKALYYLERAVNSAEINNHLEILYRGAEQLKELYREMKLYDQAYKTQAQYYEIRDSMYGLDKKIAVENFTLQNQLEIKMKADSLSASEKIKTEKILSKERDKTNRIIVYSLLGGMIFLLYFIFQIYSVSNQRKKTNTIILQQKDAIHRKQTEILDSISYAKRIQSAILPPLKLVREDFKDSFILYKPKDIVAGDFYWFEAVKGKILFAAADCTGHGVPGALVSVVCHNALNRAVKEYNLLHPDKILEKAREIIVAEFEKSDEDVKDGMDISLCCLDLGSKELLWSGAHNPLWIKRGNVLLEYKPDKQPVGKYANSKPFTSHVIILEANDEIYLFTDGFQDQFGGEQGKKFKVSRMREMLLELSDLPMEEKHKLINARFEQWRGDLEQVDDVCMIGIRV